MTSKLPPDAVYEVVSVTTKPAGNSARLTELRLALGFTIAEFADLLDVDARLVRQWEAGVYRPQHHHCKLLAEGFKDDCFLQRPLYGRAAVTEDRTIVTVRALRSDDE